MRIFKLIKENIKAGDASRIAERANKSAAIVIKILNEERKPQAWFYENALQYLIDQKRIEIKEVR